MSTLNSSIETLKKLQHLEAFMQVCQQLVEPLDLPWLDWPARMQALLILHAVHAGYIEMKRQEVSDFPEGVQLIFVIPCKQGHCSLVLHVSYQNRLLCS